MLTPNLTSKYVAMRPRPPLWLVKAVGAKTPKGKAGTQLIYAGLDLLVTDLDAFDDLSEIVLDERDLRRFRWQS